MSKEVLDRHWRELRFRPGVMNVGLGDEFAGGVKTGRLAIRVYVQRKIARVELSANQLLPDEIEGVPIDVQEIAPTTWQAGETEISKLHPEEQLRRLGFNPQPPKVRAAMPLAAIKTPVGHSDWTAVANAIQDQMNCGSCLAFDYTGVWEAWIAIVAKVLVPIIKLSESHLFSCTPNASCNGGSTVDDMIVAAMQGVCTEADWPYKDVDQVCGSGFLKPDWYLRARRLAGQNAISDPNQILSLLDSGPLVATFQVPQSFLNYMGGVYDSLGPSDPIVGGHGVGAFGYDITVPVVYRIMRNQWKGWGQNCVINGIARPGWFMINPALLDPVMYQLNLSTDPVPAPVNPPAPVKKCWLLNVLSKM